MILSSIVSVGRHCASTTPAGVEMYDRRIPRLQTERPKLGFVIYCWHVIILEYDSKKKKRTSFKSEKNWVVDEFCNGSSVV
jgi:hypothetical protein